MKDGKEPNMGGVKLGEDEENNPCKHLQRERARILKNWKKGQYGEVIN